MRLLHTSDWHVGKAIRGRSRAQEHQAVLAEIAGIAGREAVDLVIVAGDLFDTSTPTAESERIVYRVLLDLAADGRPVIVVAGNHDSAPRLQAVAPLSEASGIRVASAISPADDGGVVELAVGGEVAQVALLPSPPQRYVVTADLLLSGDAADAHAAYADRVVRIVRTLTDRFRADSVNLVVAHLMVMGGTMGGGERGAHTVFDYWVPATAFPPSSTSRPGRGSPTRCAPGCPMPSRWLWRRVLRPVTPPAPLRPTKTACGGPRTTCSRSTSPSTTPATSGSSLCSTSWSTSRSTSRSATRSVTPPASRSAAPPAASTWGSGDEARAARGRGVHGGPPADGRRVRRRRPVRPGRSHRRGQDQHHRRPHVRALRLGAPARRPAGGGAGDQPEPPPGPP